MYRPQQSGKDKNKAPRGVIVCMPRRPKAEDGLPDILWYKQALNRLGYYMPDAAQGITDDARDDRVRHDHALRDGRVYS